MLIRSILAEVIIFVLRNALTSISAAFSNVHYDARTSAKPGTKQDK